MPYPGEHSTGQTNLFLNFLIMVGGETFDPSFFGYAYGVVGVVEEHIVDDDAF